MFFNKQRRALTPQKRYFYGKTPVLTSGRGIFKKKKNVIQNIVPNSKKLKKIIALILTATVVFSLTYWIFLSGFFKINEIVIDYDELQNENAFLKNYFNNLTGKNIIFAKLDPGIEKITAEHPEFKLLIVKKDYPHKIRISFSEYPSAANVINAVQDGVFKFILNEIGFAAQKDIENPNLPFIKIKTEKPFEENSIIILQEKLTYILSAIKFFEEKFGMQVLDSEYKIYERELYLRTEKYFKVMLDMQKPYEEQMLKLKKSLSKLDIYNTPLEYIDLRVYSANGEKIIYKRRK